VQATDVVTEVFGSSSHVASLDVWLGTGAGVALSGPGVGMANVGGGLEECEDLAMIWMMMLGSNLPG
jgi:hypothetical protein